MKAYTFIHSYICGIQVGIQASHSNIEIMRNLTPATCIRDSEISKWADEHKTFVWLDGGDSETLEDTINLIQAASIPYAYFNEPAMKCSSAGPLDAGMITAVTAVLTEKQVELCSLIRTGGGTIVPRNNNTEACFSFRDALGGYTYTDNICIEKAKLFELIAKSRSKSL